MRHYLLALEPILELVDAVIVVLLLQVSDQLGELGHVLPNYLNHSDSCYWIDVLDDTAEQNCAAFEKLNHIAGIQVLTL